MIDGDKVIVDGLALLARQQLSSDKGFYIITFDQIGNGEFLMVGDGVRRKGLEALEAAARGLRKTMGRRAA